MELKGLGVSEGVGIGKSVVIENEEVDVSKYEADPAGEKDRLTNAAESLMAALEKKTEEAAGEQAEILGSHVEILKDPALMTEMVKLIENENCNSEYAAGVIFDQYIQMFSLSGDELLELRASDLKDIKNNLLITLSGKELMDISQLPAGSILVAEELTTSIAAGINPENISAIVTKVGGQTSHMSIIARSIGIPAVVGISTQQIENDVPMIVDGSQGTVLLNPTKECIKEYQEKQNVLEQSRLALEKYRGVKSVTLDNQEIELCANIGLELDIEYAVKADAEGVGLFRSEFLYMNRNSAPSEEEQFKVYKKAAAAFGDEPVIIRTLDVGGDKEIPYMELEKEENPFLGWRAIRYCLDKQGIFITQLRAILRASAFGAVKIMIPMISAISEIKKVKELIQSVKSELAKENVEFDNEIPVGIMVETPAAAVLADQFAKEVDFFSIGTNDLTQYIMAVDRGNKKVADLYSTYNPAVMRLIYHVAQSAEANGIMCGVCGESAADPLLIKFLIGSGIKELSMSGVKILQAREIVRNSSYQELKEKVKEHLDQLQEVEDAVNFLNSL